VKGYWSNTRVGFRRAEVNKQQEFTGKYCYCIEPPEELETGNGRLSGNTGLGYY
jgi:hypothetical protein